MGQDQWVTVDELAALSHPRQSARTRRFTLGAPRAISVTPDGSRVVFVRSTGPTDATNRLWVLDVDGAERLVADPAQLLADGVEELSEEEKARRERIRETTAGVTSYSLSHNTSRVCFALSSRLFVADLDGAEPVRELAVPGPVIDPRLSPDGSAVSYSDGSSLHFVDVDSGSHRVLCASDSDTVVWGMANFVAAEEFARARGHWWAPDSTALLVERFDDAPVETWWISDPAHPDAAPRSNRYPAAGTANPAVSLWVVTLAGETNAVQWDTEEFEYVVAASWPSAGSGPLVTLISRDQRRCVIADVDPVTGQLTVRREILDAQWVETLPGLPAVLPDGGLLHLLDDTNSDTRRLAIDGTPVTPEGLQVRAVIDVGDTGVVINAAEEPTVGQSWFIRYDGWTHLLSAEDRWEPCVAAAADAGVIVLARSGLDTLATTYPVLRRRDTVAEIASYAAVPVHLPNVHLHAVGADSLATAVLFPRDHVPGSAKLPVIMAPYGGPGHAVVVSAARAYADDQWLADQGFAVISADGRGTPNRGPEWDRSISREFAKVTLEDQVRALHAVAELYPDDLDLDRVGITGWSYGGYLAALAVLARPDVFHAAVAGAPVTQWRLYDTGYTERYLGHPDFEPEVYDRNSLVPMASGLQRPLLLIHGFADDNVVVAHTLQLSSALLAAGKAHTVLPMSGVTHMTPQETIAENLLLLQVEFFATHLSR